jgi:DNA polymerase III sliding clamp (beta) subunit (PCNA family)
MGDQNLLWTARIETKKLLEIFEDVSQYIDESNLHISKDGVGVKSSDRTMVCFINTLIPTSQFETYSLSEEQTIAINLVNLVSVLKRGNKEKTTLNLTKDTLTINFGTREFTIPQLAIKTEELPNTTELKFKAKAEIKGSAFKTAIEDSEVVSDNMVIGMNKDNITFWASGNTQMHKTFLQKGDDKIFELSGEGESRYSLDYLKKLRHLAEKISLEFGTEFPLRIVSNNGCEFSLILAPRISESS